MAYECLEDQATAAIAFRAWGQDLEVGCPRIVYTDVNGLWLLARFGECQVMG